jgi:hypothetical protein
VGASVNYDDRVVWTGGASLPQGTTGRVTATALGTRADGSRVPLCNVRLEQRYARPRTYTQASWLVLEPAPSRGPA